MIKLKTINFIKSHKHWKELLMAPPYSLKITEDVHYYMLRYNQIESDFSQRICNECRGLIIDKATLEPVALSFFKFYNYGQPEASPIDWSTAQVQEKVDGSKILMFWNQYNKEWQICTSGMLNAYDTSSGIKTFGSLFEEAIQNVTGKDIYHFSLYLDTDKIYTFELVSPYNKVVVPYTETKCYLIGQRDKNSFLEEIPHINNLSFPKPAKYSHSSLSECIVATEQMDYTEEGYVVVDAHWNRIKIKGASYLQAHYLSNNNSINNKRIYDIIAQGEEGEFLSYFPEYRPDFDKIYQNIEKYKALGREAIIETLKREMTDRKEMAKFVFANYPEYSDIVFSFMDHIDAYLDLYLKKATENAKEKFKIY